MRLAPFNPAHPVHALLRSINNERGYGDVVGVDMPTDTLPGHLLIRRPFMRDTLRRFTMAQDGRGYTVTYAATTRRLRAAKEPV